MRKDHLEGRKYVKRDKKSFFVFLKITSGYCIKNWEFQSAELEKKLLFQGRPQKVHECPLCTVYLKASWNDSRLRLRACIKRGTVFLGRNKEKQEAKSAIINGRNNYCITCSFKSLRVGEEVSERNSLNTWLDVGRQRDDDHAQYEGRRGQKEIEDLWGTKDMNRILGDDKWMYEDFQ